MNKAFKSELFSWELSKYMKRNQLSIKELAKIAEVGYETARKWVHGESFPNDYSIQVIDYKTQIDALKYNDKEFLESMVRLYNEGMHIHEMF